MQTVRDISEKYGDMPVAELTRRMKKLLGVRWPHADDVRLLLIDTRIALEHLDLSREFPTIGLYGDWCCHPELSRSVCCHGVVVDVQKAYEHVKARERGELAKQGLTPERAEAKVAQMSPEPMNEFFENVKNCFRIQELRDELVHFYDEHGVDTTIIRFDSNWEQFIFLLLHAVAGRTLTIPELKRDKPHPTLEGMKKRAERERFTPKRLFIEEKPVKGEAGAVELWWVIEMLGPFNVTGLLMKGIYPNV